MGNKESKKRSDEKKPLGTTSDDPSVLCHRTVSRSSKHRYFQVIQRGTHTFRRMRLMIVGHYGAGKTTLSNGIIGCHLGSDVASTDGITLFRAFCSVRNRTGTWEMRDRLQDEDHMVKAFGTVLADAEKHDGLSCHITLEDLTKRQSEHADELFEKIDNSRMVNGGLGDILVDIWDFAGQTVFYTTHQSFFSPRSIYILVLNLELELHTMVNDIGLGREERSSVLEYLNFWIAAITSYSTGSVSGFPRILLVGTHLDSVNNPSQKIEMLMSTITNKYKALVDSQQLIVDKRLFLNAKNLEDEVYSFLRTLILEETRKYPHWEEPYANRRLHLQDMIMSERDKGTDIMTLQNIKDLNASCITPLTNEEILSLLQTEHEFGNIIFFNQEEFNAIVVLNPNLIIKALRKIVTSKEHFQPKDSTLDIWRNLSVQGVSSEEVIQLIWEKGNLFSLTDPFNRMQQKIYTEHLIKIFQKSDVIVRPKLYRDGEEETSPILFVPCMVTDESGKRKVKDFLKSNADSYVSFCIEIEDTIVPPAIGYKLIAFCVSTWPVMQNRLYLRCGVFRLDLFHLLIVQFSLPAVEVFICHKRSKKAISAKVATSVNEALTSFLQRVITTYTKQFKVKSTYVQEANVLKEEYCSLECQGLPLECMSKKVEEVDLARIARAVTGIEHLYVMGTALGVEADILERAKADHTSFADQMFFVLRAWKNTSAKGTFFEIRKTLKESEIDDHILCKIYQLKRFDEICSEIPGQIVEQVPTQEQMDQVSHLVGREYLQFGLELGLRSAFIEQTMLEYKGNILGCIRELLKKWKSLEFKPTVRALASAIYHCTLDFSAFKDIFIRHDEEDTWDADWH